MTLAHRYRFVAPLCAGKTVLDVAGPNANLGELATAARLVADETTQADIVVALAETSSSRVLRAHAAWCDRLVSDGILVVVTATADATLKSALSRRFSHIAAFAQRPVIGSIIATDRFAQSRATPLMDRASGDAADPKACIILVCANVSIHLAAGLFETTAAPAHLPEDMLLETTPAAESGSPILRSNDIPRANAVSLVERLLELDEQIFALTSENHAQCGAKATASKRVLPISHQQEGRAADPDLFSWPLIENPGASVDHLDLYDRRPDDDVVEAARSGETFVSKYGLRQPVPDFAGAVAALNATEPVLRLSREDGAGSPPDVSIIIPVFAQLAYTLNCLDGLLSHASLYSCEIIVVDDASPDRTAKFLSHLSSIRLHRRRTNGGFIAACNDGAAKSRGRYVVLLNNDTRPLPGWLDELIGSFVHFPNAGLVGSKLLYPDGTLQEAGGIVWRDGTAWNYGRGSDPNQPRFCHARQVDYVSGASIAVPLNLWKQLGGLDPFYAPAYYEDTDLAFRVRAQGHQVWYQPVSRAIHFEGITSGNDLNTGAKAFQTRNAIKFFSRWRKTLQTHGYSGTAVNLERERKVLRRAVLLDDTTPTSKQDAGSNYSLLTMRLFHSLCYKLNFIPQDNFLYQHGYTTDLHRIGIECAYAPYDVDSLEYLRRKGHLFDVVLVSRMQILERVINELAEFVPQAPILFNTHDLNFLRMQRDAIVSDDPAMALAAENMRARELGLMRRVDCIITPSAFEGELLSVELPDIPRYVLPIMTDLEGTSIGFSKRRDVCFLGGYRHPPNIDAVKFFLSDIFPLLKAEEPQMRFIMAGANPTPELLALAREDVVVTGMIDDLRDLFDKVRVFACPLRIGAGAKGKIASAMSYGLPIVSTSIGAEGMGLENGKTVLIADEPADFASACLRLYRDWNLWGHLSTASQEFVASVTSPDVRERIFSDAIEAAYRHKFGAAP
jgi:GT2 family glycosyltransferase/glycosyltransferase involved in cell wall biosynthesis